MSIGFATFRRIRTHHRNGSDISSSSNNSNPPLPDMVQQTKSRYAQQKKEARALWEKLEPLIKNDWQWPDPPTSERKVDESKEYAERTITALDETVEDVTSSNGLKRKRQVRAETLNESAWNGGLRTFEERRKAWTGAVDVFLPPGNATDHEKVQIMRDSPAEMLAAVEKVQDETSDDSSMEVDATGSDNLDPTMHELGTTLLPFYMPILPTSLTITQSQSNAEADKVLYKNIVTDSKTAIAPIPLASVVRACVAGLKEADEWPPKATPQDPLVGKVNKEKRRSRIKTLLGMKQDAGLDDVRNSPEVIAIEAGFETPAR